MPKQKVNEGDIVAVPLNDGSEALCRILYRSAYFKKVILLACYGRWSRTSDVVAQTTGPIIGQFYCGCQNIENVTWRYLGNGSVSLAERQQSKRIVGGDVWLADECLGPVTSSTADLPHMHTYGERVLVKTIERVLHG
jgi:hypothetical protein